MKKSFIVLFSLMALGFIYLSIKGRELQVITTEIEIAASPEKVWNIIIDIEKWQHWSPIINKSSGTASLGSALEITMKGKQEGESGPQYTPEIIKLDSPNYFQWRAFMVNGFIFTNDKVFELKATKNGTLLIHKETFKGLLSPIFCGQMEKSVPAMLNSMNKALKKLAERL
jgi:hypothetical protein